ncbi:hypothetical protein LOZ12_006140 [Ophidiomyces ophidiicola]|uniref:Uncharacterized protein n=1 Tax=Ophidiomyces ophidiicola TaxID=1387563 RepID=A0ACB8UY72_9EURO|nr:uncharacterized protein LOZ57_002099 [Ophidiomyces ophidiicola]KAI1934863.1 hypothetical protein LOZ62_006155 [Ophidiomyces ophidiicola]KAI1948565.1 hypothetical protein LOZ59_006337 [Ophidiomyces ophidiicola]KAI1950537.1 hypothetical protein LOZ57_002099 [Ophidiomyces ophidiicola]KAI1967717.1 hypothetical protein LOZ56_005373 [Ophidiomyces ophidiicola]KAI2022078.1 hypothetical protein LOZ45_004485 [Ophidiomyces ophidiicola]
MALPLYIPPCIQTPARPYHFPAPDKPLRIRIEGPTAAIERLLPNTPWRLELANQQFPQPAGPELARLAFQTIYGRDVTPDSLAVRHEYLRWVAEKHPEDVIDYYGVTFDHLVPAGDINPEVMVINIVEVEEDNGAEANQYLLFQVDPKEYIGKKVLAVPRCCQMRKGTQDRWALNSEVLGREDRQLMFMKREEWDKYVAGRVAAQATEVKAN